MIPSYNNEITVLLQQHGIQPGSIVSIERVDGSVISGKLVYPNVHGASLLLFEDDEGDHFGLQIETIENIQEIGFSPLFEPSTSADIAQPKEGLSQIFHHGESPAPTRPSLFSPTTEQVTPQRKWLYLEAGFAQESTLRTFWPDWKEELFEPSGSNKEGELHYKSPVFKNESTPQIWTELAKCLHQSIQEGFQGLVLGLQREGFTESTIILSYMLQNPPIPIVLLKPPPPHKAPNHQAKTHLMLAIKAAQELDLGGFLILQQEAGLKPFYTFTHPSKRQFQIGQKRTQSTVIAIHEDDCFRLKSPESPPRRLDREVTFYPYFNSDYSVIHLMHGPSSTHLEALLSSQVQAFLLVTTSTGHIPKSYYPFLQRAYMAGILLCLVGDDGTGPAFPEQSPNADWVRELDICCMGPLSIEAASLKVGWVLARTQGRVDFMEWMKRSLTGE